ncbi:MAG: glycosyl hydrolase [Bryobacteraceae bacterium]
MSQFVCDYGAAGRPFIHSWEDTIGSGHAPLALRADWQAQLLRCHKELGVQRVRFHDLLSDEMGTLICENEKLLYSFFNADRIVDYILSIGMSPFIELSFMPRTLSSGNKTVFHYNANVTPPKDYAKNVWIPEFLDFCKRNHTPADFVSTHHYPTDAFGKVGADTLTQLEHAPRGIMRQQVQQARREAGDKPLYYTEWNISSNPRDTLHDEPFAAAFVTKIIMEAQEFVQGYSFWTFSDLFEENYFPSMPFQGGFGLLNLQGVAKPAYRAFELLHQLGEEALTISGSHDTVDAWVVRKGTSVTVLLTNLSMPRKPIQTELIEIRMQNTPKPSQACIQRIDEDHSNPRKLWVSLGQPAYLSALQVGQLDAQSSLVTSALPVLWEDGNLAMKVALPPQSVAAITVEFA